MKGEIQVTEATRFRGVWEMKCLGDHLKFLRHGTNPRSDLTTGGAVRYLHYGDIHKSADPYLDPDVGPMPTLTIEQAVRLDPLDDGDLVFVDASEDIEGVGKSVELKGLRGRHVVAGLHTIAVRFNKSVLADGFKAYLQFHPGLLCHLRRLAAGTKVYATNRTHIASAQLPLPALPEQRAIAAVLSDVDELIGSLEALVAKKRAIKQAAMQELLTGRTRLPGFEGKWDMVVFGDVADIRNGGTPRTGVPAYWGGRIPWCVPTDITASRGKYLTTTTRKITPDGLANCGASLLPAGALLLCSRATIGEVKIASMPVATNQGFKSMVCAESVDYEFLYYRVVTLKERMIDLATGSTFLEISKRDLANIQINIPPSPEQHAIATVLCDMDSEIAALERRLDKTQAIKQGVMQQLLTGAIRMPIPSVDGEADP